MKKFFGATALLAALSLPGLALAGADAPKAGADMKPTVAKEAAPVKAEAAKGAAVKADPKAKLKAETKAEGKEATKAAPAAPAGVEKK